MGEKKAKILEEILASDIIATEDGKHSRIPNKINIKMSH